MLCVVATIAAIGFLLANPVADQVDAFRDNVPEIVDDANATLADVQRWLDENGINVQIAEEGQTALGTLGQNLSEGSGELVAFTQDALRTLVEASLALILVIVISVYMLLYGERIGAGSDPSSTAPTPTTTRCGSSARCSATSAARSCSR